MKLNKIALTLTAVALLPTFAYAGTDAVAASFERGLYREPVKSVVAITGETDSLVDVFNVALYGTTDTVLASFERDLHREPMSHVVAIDGEVDSLAGMFSIALSSELSKPAKQVAISGKHNRGS